MTKANTKTSNIIQCPNFICLSPSDIQILDIQKKIKNKAYPIFYFSWS